MNLRAGAQSLNSHGRARGLPVGAEGDVSKDGFPSGVIG